MTQSARRRPAADAEPVRVLGRGLRAARGVRLSLRSLRDAAGKTQVDVARDSRMDQADISRLEARAEFDDCQVATLRRYVESLGGSFELVARFGDKRIAISGNQVPDGKPANKALQQTGLSRRLRRRSGARS
jgi:hypothetical protein